MTNPVRYIHLLILMTMAMLLSACAGVSPRTDFHTLYMTENLCNPLDTMVLPKAVVIGVGPVSLADPLNRPQLITRTSQGQIRFEDFQRWSGELADNIAQVLAECLARRLDSPQVFAYPWLSGLHPDYRIRINIERFDGQLGEKAEIKADWLIFDASDKPLYSVERSQITQKIPGNGYDELVRALEQGLARMSASIAEKLAANKTGPDVTPDPDPPVPGRPFP